MFKPDSVPRIKYGVNLTRLRAVTHFGVQAQNPGNLALSVGILDSRSRIEYGTSFAGMEYA